MAATKDTRSLSDPYVQTVTDTYSADANQLFFEILVELKTIREFLVEIMERAEQA